MTVALALTVWSVDALAQEDDGSRRSARAEDDLVREVVRGFYLKSNIGTTVYAPPDGVPLSGVISLGFGAGSEFIDKERFSAAWEVQFSQSLFNGPRFDQLSDYGPVVQGDIHAFAGSGLVEVSGYVSRRTGFGGRAGGGVMFAPLIVTRAVYDEDLVPVWGQEAAFHAGPLPFAIVGGTFEYYTKLSHFSVGVDVDANIILPNLYISVAPLGFLKYTF